MRLAASIDDIAVRQQDTNLSGTFNDTWYHLTDTLFSTIVIIDDAANLIERVSYYAYGNARHHRMADLDGDGAVTSPDSLLLLANWENYGTGDLNRDGTADLTDLLLLNGNYGPAQPAGRISVGSTGTDNIIGYAGYVFNAEMHGSGLYTVRDRHYSPELGRWISRDPLGYVDGMGLYEYVRGRVYIFLDPSGEQAHDVPFWPFREITPGFYLPYQHLDPARPNPQLSPPRGINGNLTTSPPFILNPDDSTCSVEFRCNDVIAANRFTPALRHCYLVITNPDGTQTEVRAGPLNDGSGSDSSNESVAEDPCRCGGAGRDGWGPIVPYIGPHGPNARPDGTSSPDGTKPVTVRVPVTSTTMSGCQFANCLMRVMQALGQSCQDYVLGTDWSRNSNTAISTALGICGAPDPKPGNVVAPGWGEPWYRQ